MFFKSLAVSGAVAATALILSGAPAQSAMTHSQQDLTFATKAAQGGAAEVSDAKQALQTSRNQQVDAFANRMITDHGKANAQLASIMRRQGIAAPATIGAENQAAYSRMESLTGRAFNVTYLAQQKTAHEQTIGLFETEIRRGRNPQLVSFAKATLPVVKMHLAMLSTVKP